MLPHPSYVYLDQVNIRREIQKIPRINRGIFLSVELFLHSTWWWTFTMPPWPAPSGRCSHTAAAGHWIRLLPGFVRGVRSTPARVELQLRQPQQKNFRDYPSCFPLKERILYFFTVISNEVEP